MVHNKTFVVFVISVTSTLTEGNNNENKFP